MANQQLSRFIVQMHRPTKAVLEHLAISARALLHPGAVTERLETVFPDIEEIVLINIALHIAAVNVGTSGNRAVNEDGADSDARPAEIEPVTDLALVGAHIGLATELTVNPSLFSGGNNEVHELVELLVAELQALISGGTPNGVDGE